MGQGEQIFFLFCRRLFLSSNTWTVQAKVEFRHAIQRRTVMIDDAMPV